MKITSNITIKAKAPKVFDVFTDLSKAPERITEIMSLEMLEGPEKMAVGTKWKETRKVFGKESTETMWVSELTKNKSYSVDAESHGSKYHSTFTFSETKEGTNVSWAFEGIPQSLMAKIMSLTACLFSGSMKKLMDKDLEDLKKACEA